MKYKTIKFKKFYSPFHEDEIGIPFTFNGIECMAVKDKKKFTIYEFYSGLKISFTCKKSIKDTLKTAEMELESDLTKKFVKQRRLEIPLINKRFNRKIASYNDKILWRGK